jgi:hypothetical protein
MDCTPLPVGNNHTAGYDILHMAPPSRAAVPSINTSPTERADQLVLGVSGTPTSASLAATMVAPIGTLGASTPSPCSPGAKHSSLVTNDSSSPTVVRSPLAVGVGYSSPGVSRTSMASLADANAPSVGALASSPVAVTTAPSDTTTHHTSTSSTVGAGSSPTCDSLPRVVPTTKVVAIPPIENAHTMCTCGKMGLRILPSPWLNL